MKLWGLFLGLILFSFVDAQTKYALLLSGKTYNAHEEQVAANNIKLVREGLDIQGFAPANIQTLTVPTRLQTIKALSRINDQVKRGDFIFIYFNANMDVDHSTNEMKLYVDKNDREQSISIGSLQQMLTTISKKINDPSVFFVSIDGEVHGTETPGVVKLESREGSFLNFIFSGQTDQPAGEFDNASYFAHALSAAMGSINEFNLTYRSFFNNVRKRMQQLGAPQQPQLVSATPDLMLFNGKYVSFPSHFRVTEQLATGKVKINAGERLNIFPGASVKFYKAYSDPRMSVSVGEGTIEESSPFFSTVKLTKALPSGEVWAFVGSNNVPPDMIPLKFLNSFSGDPQQQKTFASILADLKKTAGNRLQFVERGGDVGIVAIRKTLDKLTLTLADPVNGIIYNDIDYSGEEGKANLDDFLKRLARFEYIARFRNDIPEIAVDMEWEYVDSMKVVKTENGFPVFHDGEEMGLRIVNRSPNKVYFALLDLQPDKICNTLFPNSNANILPEDCMIPPGGFFDSRTQFPFTITPPFGIEKFKVITSLTPINMSMFEGQGRVTRGASAESKFENYNIQDYSFEIRNSVYAGNADRKTVESLLSGPATSAKSFIVRNKSQGRLYYNLLHELADGSYEVLIPGPSGNEGNYFVPGSDRHVIENINASIKEGEQLITLYADRPFNMRDLAKKQGSMNDLILQVIKKKSITDGPGRIFFEQQVFIPQKTVAKREGETINIRMITPKVGNDRSIGVKTKEPQADINGFAIAKDNTAVKTVRINNEVVNYDRDLKYFEKTVPLTAGVNKVVIEAEDDKGFKSYKILQMEVENSVVTSASPGKNYFFGVAINDYKSWPKLSSPVNDIRDVAKLLDKKFGFDSVKFLIDGEATRGRIINSIRQMIGKIGPNDNLIIYLAGHGNEDPLADGGFYFMPQEADPGDVTTAVKSSDILDNFRKIQAKHCILIVDACYAGMITNDIVIKQVVQSGVNLDPEKLPSKWIITSGRGTVVSDGEGHSPFALEMLDYLTKNSDPAKLKLPLVISYLEDAVHKKNPDQQPMGKQIDGLGVPCFRVRQAAKQ